MHLSTYVFTGYKRTALCPITCVVLLTVSPALTQTTPIAATAAAAQQPADSPATKPDSPPNGLAEYKAGNYSAAIPLLQTAAARNPQDPRVAAALLSSLVYEGQVDDASAAADRDSSAFPNAPEVMAARGEFELYMGDLFEAERLFKAAVKIQENTARALFGLYRLNRLASNYHSARILCLAAHQTDPDDGLITFTFLRFATPAKRQELEPPFAAAHPWFYTRQAVYDQTESEVAHELKEHRAFEIEGEPHEVTLPLYILRSGVSNAFIRGVGIEVGIAGGRPLRLLFDTGASGIIIRQAIVDKAGLKHFGSTLAGGIGDRGPQNGFLAVADTCNVATLQFQHCVFEALEGKGRIGGDEDGLIGADFFADYIVSIDFQKLQLHLTPQPSRPPNPQGYNRIIPPSEAGFTPVYRYGHELLVYTRLNGKSNGLFLLDTGSNQSVIDSTFARLSTKVRGDEYSRVKGISGQVRQVFEADKAELQFAHFRQRNLGLTSFNLNNSPAHQDFRMGGILGTPILTLFRLTIDYRNALVNFDYVLK